MTSTLPTHSTKRRYCPRCHYPQSHCLCDAINPMACKHTLIILQHPKEAKHSKNSAKLVNLCIDNCSIHIGEQSQDFAAVSNLIVNQPQPTYLVYPSPNASPIEQLADNSDQRGSPITLILIDASWRKAYKMYQLNPWLQQLPTLTFVNARQSRYQIRTSKKQNSLATIEAVAYCLETLGDHDTKALYIAFEAMINNHLRHRQNPSS